MIRQLIPLIALAGAAVGQAHAADLTISCGAVGAELTLCKQGVAAWEEKTGHSVAVISTPNSSTERLSLYQQILSAQSGDIDVMQIDVVWPGLLANHLVDLQEIGGKGIADGHFQTIVDNNTVDGRLVAMPWFTDAGVLYYRKDLLDEYDREVPETWQQMTATAEVIQQGERQAGKDGMWGYVFQGRAYEGLTCNALEWVASYGGGSIVDDQGEITIDNPRAAAALDQAAEWIGNISPKGVLNYTEEEARGVFQSGNAVFMRNWPYAWALAQSESSDVQGKVGVTMLPHGPKGSSAATLGGWNLAVSKYSNNPELAVDLVKFLTSEAEQKRRAIAGAYNPTIKSLYQDKEVLAAVPFFGKLYDTFTNAVARPSAPTGEKYGRVSNAFFNAAHNVLSGSMNGTQAVSQLQDELERMKRRRW
ncbi:ABC transporter substrate-binding protein [Chromohalobacter sp. HP20-39]|uniref:ABC transporter substrate-binding protein n=1 Tax=Chromohalobacter sp. HP20-39 TaxID=3079306 RepID=UPI00294B0FCF|nr:ABC transporter substrate-binding protein [Chromohalobacter sp. HP20-39]MDV6318188.1 ABC transporter substrate-binding protein [Chromohalobacter sp. HP20-39]